MLLFMMLTGVCMLDNLVFLPTRIKSDILLRSVIMILKKSVYIIFVRVCLFYLLSEQ